MKLLVALMLLATLVSCAAPAPEPAGDAAVVEPGIACRVNHAGGPTLAERGIGGTGAPVRSRVVDRGIGGTGIIGVVTGFASVCVDGLEVRIDKNVPVLINGSVTTPGRLRVGQVVIIQADGQIKAPDFAIQARSIAVRYELSGPIEAIDRRGGTIVVAGQRVTVLPTTWAAGRFSIGNWIIVSGLRQPDGTIVASRLDHAPVDAFAVLGKISRDGDVTHIGGLILRGPAAAAAKAGVFVSVAGKYKDGVADVTATEPDLLEDNPTAYFGATADRIVVQAFVHAEPGLVSLNNGQKFLAGPKVQGNGNGYRNAIVWMERGADGSFRATDLHYTSYRAQPKAVPSRTGEHRGPGDVAPPYLPPWMPPDTPPAGVIDDNSTISGALDTSRDKDGPVRVDDEPAMDPAPVPNDFPASGANPSRADPIANGPFVTEGNSVGRHYGGPNLAYLAGG